MTNAKLKTRILKATDPDTPYAEIASGVSAKTAARIEKHAAQLGYRVYFRPARHSGFTDVEVLWRNGRAVRVDA